jgi:uncharacterized protein
MKRYDNQQRTGHLLIFMAQKASKDNFSFFFPIAGLGDLDRLFAVSEGFQHCLEKIGNLSNYEFQSLAVNDIGCVRDNLPEIDEKRLCRLELGQFIDEHEEFVDEFAETVITWFARESMQELPALRTGAIATGSSFFDRRKEKELIGEKVLTGKSILLQSPRRYGKSSLLKHIQQNPFPGWKVCYVDLQGAKSAADFLEMLVGDLMISEGCVNCLPQNLAKKEPWKLMVHERGELRRKERKTIKDGWREYGSGLFNGMNTGDKKVLLIFDEFSYMLEDMVESSDGNQTTEEFMEWFSDVRKKAKHVSFILSGSEHLQTFLRRHGIDGKSEDLEQVPLGLFDRQTALSLMLLLFIREGISVRKNELDGVLHLMGEPIPYFLQIFVDLLGAECRRRGELVISDIEDLYYKQLLGPDGKRHFESIEQQLDRYERYTQGGREAAKKLLGYLASPKRKKVEKEDLKGIWTANGGASGKFDDMIDLMTDDFYIVVDSENNVGMASNLIRDWWGKYTED